MVNSIQVCVRDLERVMCVQMLQMLPFGQHDQGERERERASERARERERESDVCANVPVAAIWSTASRQQTF